MRFVVCLFIGLLVGAISATTAASILRQRHAYPRALMGVLQHELIEARDSAHSRNCTDNPRHLATLGVLAKDIPEAIAGIDRKDRVFMQYAADLSKRIGEAGAVDCPEQSHALTELANACEACHRDYR